MRPALASNIMPRTTIDIDKTVLSQVKRLARAQGKTIAAVVSELLAIALFNQSQGVRPGKLSWTAKPMRARVDLEDKEAVHEALERG